MIKILLIIITLFLVNTQSVFAADTYSVPINFKNSINFEEKKIQEKNKINNKKSIFAVQLSSDLKIEEIQSVKLIQNFDKNKNNIQLKNFPITKEKKSSLEYLYSYKSGIRFEYNNTIKNYNCDYDIYYSNENILNNRNKNLKYRISQNKFYEPDIIEKFNLNYEQPKNNFYLLLFRYFGFKTNEIIYIRDKNRIVYKFLFDFDLINSKELKFNLDPKISSVNLKFNSNGKKFLNWDELDKSIDGEELIINIRSSISKKYPDIINKNAHYSDIEFVLFGNENITEVLERPLNNSIYVTKERKKDKSDFKENLILNRTDNDKYISDVKFSNEVIEVLNFGKNPSISINSNTENCINLINKIYINYVDVYLMPSSFREIIHFSKKLGFNTLLSNEGEIEYLNYPKIINYFNTSFKNTNDINIRNNHRYLTTQNQENKLSKDSKLVLLENYNSDDSYKIHLNFDTFSVIYNYDGGNKIINLKDFAGKFLKNITIENNNKTNINTELDIDIYLLDFIKITPEKLFENQIPNINLKSEIFSPNNFSSKINRNNTHYNNELFMGSDLIKLEYNFPGINNPCISFLSDNYKNHENICFNNNKGLLWINKESVLFKQIITSNSILIIPSGKTNFSILLSSFKFNLPSIRNQLIKKLNPSYNNFNFQFMEYDDSFIKDYLIGNSWLYYVGNEFLFPKNFFTYERDSLGIVKQVLFYGNAITEYQTKFHYFYIYLSIFILFSLIAIFLKKPITINFLNFVNIEIFLNIIILIFIFYFIYRLYNVSLYFNNIKDLIAFCIVFFYYNFYYLNKTYKINFNYNKLNFIISITTFSIMGILFILGYYHLSEVFGLIVFLIICISCIHNIINVKK